MALFPGLNPEINLTSIDKETTEWDKIERYFHTTQGSTHNLSVDLVDVLRIEKPEATPRPKFSGEKILLWHGTKQSNIPLILNEGLLMEPTQKAVVRRNGLMFGKGIYFADSFSKSAQYSSGGVNSSYIFLCEVALGNVFIAFNSITQPTIDVIIKNGYDSIKGVGKTSAYDLDGEFLGNARVPSGVLGSLPVENDHAALMYNEYIVYDDHRVKLKYLVHFENRNRVRR